MRFQQLINDVVTDKKIAAEFKKYAMSACKKGAGTDEWKAFMEKFVAETPDELALLTVPGQRVKGVKGAPIATSITTVFTTLHTGITGTMTTLTTCSLFCVKSGAGTTNVGKVGAKSSKATKKART